MFRCTPKRPQTLRLAAALAGLALANSAWALSSLPTSGTCAFVTTSSYPFVYLYGQSPGNGWGINFLGTLNFSTNTITLNAVIQNPGNGTPLQEVQTSGSTTFTIGSGPIAGSSSLSFTLPGSSTAATLNVIPVNSGNTLLLQQFNATAGSQDGGNVAVCQF